MGIVALAQLRGQFGLDILNQTQQVVDYVLAEETLHATSERDE
jgi:hypothetical protein